MPLFTVIINNYNYLPFLPAAVYSIREQRFQDYELIIVDDGSDDGSLDYIASLEPGYRLIQTTRLGQARACLTALNYAQGQYIYFLDADDMAAPHLLETAALHLDGRPAKIQFRLVPVDRDGLIFAPAYPDLRPEHHDEFQRREIRRTGLPTSPPTSGNIFRRDLLDAIADIPYETAIDGVALLFAPFLGPVVSINDGLGFYRVHALADSAHASPVDPKRIRRDLLRFVHRIDHLNRLLRHHRPTEAALKHGPSYFFFWDHTTLVRVATGEFVGIKTAACFLFLLLKEHRLTRFTARKIVWLAIALFGTRRLKKRLLETRLNPWPRRSATK